MAALNITEVAQLARTRDHDRVPSMQMDNSVVVQNVTFTTATQSAAFNQGTRFIRVIADADAYLLFGENPTATASNATRIEANVAEIFGVESGDIVSAYDGTS